MSERISGSISNILKIGSISLIRAASTRIFHDGKRIQVSQVFFTASAVN